MYSLKVVPTKWVVFDIETVPCLEAIRRGMPDFADTPDAQLLVDLRAPGVPTLKLVYERVVSIAAVIGYPSGLVQFKSWSAEVTPEATIISEFLEGAARSQLTLVGYASSIYDLPVLWQRALVCGISLPKFSYRPEKPWLGPDYFSEFSEQHVDLLLSLGNRSGDSRAKLADVTRACGIPAKSDGMTGALVADAWFAGEYARVTSYNASDTLATAALWLRYLRLCGADTASWDKGFRDMVEGREDAAMRVFAAEMWPTVSEKEAT